MGRDFEFGHLSSISQAISHRKPPHPVWINVSFRIKKEKKKKRKEEKKKKAVSTQRARNMVLYESRLIG